MIYLTSDLHFCHNKNFIYEPRGFYMVKHMNEAIVENWNKTVDMEDDVYVLGDIMLNDNDTGIKLLKSLKGHLHIILGNHDTDSRIELYSECYNVCEITCADRLKYDGYHFFLSHYPCFTGNIEKESLKQMTINLFGHTHQPTNFFIDARGKEIPHMYHVGVDSHNCTPISLDEIINDVRVAWKKNST